jgi:hypothetical protein
MNLGLSIVFYIIGLLVLSVIIESAVRRGINSSIIGQYLKEKHGIKENRKKSFLDSDLDNNR